MTFAMALHHFREKNVQVAVFETGMGGRLDSTNVVKPVLSVITNIGHDHQQFLGDTIEKIAAEKAGIIKDGIPVVIGQKHPETEDLFLKKATEMSAPIIFAAEHLKVTEGEIIYSGENKTPEYKIFRMETLQQKIPEQIFSGVMGSYQTENITTAAVAMAMLQNTNFPVSTTSIKEGFKNIIKNTALRGRWQTLQTSPLTVCDTGHNKEGIEQVVGMIKNTQYKKLHLVLGVVNDKDAASILQAFPANAAYYFCRASIPRSLDAEELKDTGKKIG
ncbi:MAG: dihydrofolate synthase, partial [Marinilabiliales bacterium]